MVSFREVFSDKGLSCVHSQCYMLEYDTEGRSAVIYVLVNMLSEVVYVYRL